MWQNGCAEGIGVRVIMSSEKVGSTKEKGGEELRIAASHRLSAGARTEKPWGREILVDVNEHFALKEIFIKAGTRSSLQSHRFKLETVFVLNGSLELETHDASGASFFETYRPGESYRLAPGVIHRVKALEDCTIIEASTPHLDDVIRHSDDFGRAK